MGGQDRVLRLTALIYEAALDPQCWPHFLDQFADSINGHLATLWSVRPGGDISMLASARTDPAFHAAYYEHYAEIDPWVLEGRRKDLFRPGVARLGEEIVSSSELRRTEFFNDLGRKFGLYGGLGTVFGPKGSWGCVSVSQRRFGQFGEPEQGLMEILSPHLERAMTIGSRLTDLDTLRCATEDLLEHLSVGAIIVDRISRPLVVNSVARKILGSGLRSTTAGLVAERHSETRMLRELVSACARTQAGEGLESGGTLEVSRAWPKPPLHLVVMPIRRAAGIDGTTKAAALIVVRDPTVRFEISPAMLRERYQLTMAEVRVAGLLANGQTVAQIAATLDVTVHTVRTHLKRTFHKTQTRTQGQLVRLLLLGPPVPR
jgi:DNA-binding CsgD family transcriptional regulator